MLKRFAQLCRSKPARIIIVSLAASFLLSAMFLAGMFSLFNKQVTDNLYYEKGASSDIVIVAIDDHSLQEIGRWPWPRDRFADLADRAADASVIGIDVSFFEKSLVDVRLRRVAEQRSNIVLVSEFTEFGTNGSSLEGTKLLRPIFNTTSGFANVFTDQDGVVRSFPPSIRTTNESEKAFAVVVAEMHANKTSVPISGDSMLVNFFARPGGYRRVSFHDVLTGRADINFSGKIVLVGATAANLHDTKLTPIASHQEMPGVELHANIIQTLLTTDHLKYQDQGAVLTTIFLFAIFVGYLFYRLHVKAATVGAAVAAPGFMVFAVLNFDYGTIVNVLYPILALALSYFANLALFYSEEKKQRAHVTGIFGKYVSKEVAADILKKSGAGVSLKGEKREITVMFSDIRGFTSMSEKMQPEEVVEFLNKYLTEMSDAIMRRRGVVDKYIGDAIMALWGAPLDEEEHAALACETALEMRAKSEEMSAPTGVGINTGPAVVGNVGSSDRLSYTAIGDTVNAASRLEGLNKEYGTSVIIGEATYGHVKDTFLCRELDMIKVKGKEQPVRIYELVCEKTDATAKDKKAASLFTAGLAHYRKKRWSKAITAFSKCNDQPSRAFIERCRYLKNHAPRKWDGVWTMKTK